MKTICLDLTETQLAGLRAEPLGLFMTATGLVWLPLRLSRRIHVDPACGCWLVSGHGTGKGHAKVSVAGRDRQFHRVVWQLLVGDIPEAHVLDHVKARGCIHRNCANYEHLEPVTVRVNTERGDGVKHWFGRRLVCTNHPDRPSRTNLDGDELCQECADAWVRGEGYVAQEYGDEL